MSKWITEVIARLGDPTVKEPLSREEMADILEYTADILAQWKKVEGIIRDKTLFTPAEGADIYQLAVLLTNYELGHFVTGEPR